MANNESRAHNFLLGGMVQVNSIRTINLVSRLYDERIGNANSDHLLIFLPDMHLMSDKKADERGGSRLNNEAMLVDLFKRIVQLRKESSEIRITVTQLGDFADLWGEGTPKPDGIFEDHNELYEHLHGINDGHGLSARMVIGNHDAALLGNPLTSEGWNLRYFYPVKPAPRMYATHGDVFDWVEKLPEELKAFAVHYFSNSPIAELWEAIFGGGVNTLGDFIELRRKKSKCVDPDLISKLGTMRPMQMTDDLPVRHNVKKSHRFLKKCVKRMAEMKKEHNLDIRVTAIGHTHEARIAIQEEPFYAVVDCGAWVGEYKAGKDKTKPNCQIGVICGNDARIYQLDANA